MPADQPSPNGSALRDARLRIAARPGPDRIAQHLRERYGLAVTGLTELDLGVYRVDHAEGPAWVARVFPPIRAQDAATEDAHILQLLADHAYASERIAAPDPVSQTDGHAILVTEYVDGVPRAERRTVIRELGGLRSLGEMLGKLHAMRDGAGCRPGGGWHHLVDGTPRDEIIAARQLLADCEATVADGDRAHYDTLRRELSDLDDGAGLPEALLHPDFVLANVVASRERGMVLVDWTGTGCGPRLWPLAFLLFAETVKDPRRIDLVAAGYRQHIALEPEELSRLERMIPARPVVLAVWSYCLGRVSAAEAARAATAARATGGVAAARAAAVFASHPLGGARS
jgi:Ser/Thr protein kinase RdoA (MazF antagonist)